MAGDRAQFAIDITAQLSGADATTTELDRVAKQLTASGAGAEDLEQALRQVSDQLTAARGAAQSANEAVTDGERRYRELEKAALKASDGFKKAFDSGNVAAMGELAERASDLEYQLMREAHALDELRGKARGANAEVARLERTEGNLQRTVDHVNGRFERNANALQKLRAGLGDLGGPVGQLGKNVLEPVQAFQELSAAFGTSAAGAVVMSVAALAAAVAVAALTAAVVAGVASVVAYGVALADSNRNIALTRYAFEALHPELIDIRTEIDEVSRATGMQSDELISLAGELRKAKVPAKDMGEALKAAAFAETALGKGGSREFIDSLKDGKRSVRELAYEAQSKLGGVVARQMLGLEAQGARFKRNLSETFGGLNIESMLSGFATLVKLFDQGESSGKALKFLFEAAFQPLIDGITAAIPIAEAFFLGLLIGALKIYIAFKPAIAVIKEFLGVDESSTFDWLTAAKLAAEALVFVVGALGAAFLVATGVLAAFVAGVIAIPVAIGAATVWIGEKIVAAVQSAVTAFQSVNWSELGTQMIQGLVQGIVANAAAVGSAITGVANSAITAAKKTLGIASPSKVFMSIGEDTTEGMTKGVESGSDDTAAAMTELATPPSASDIATPGASGSTSSGAPARGASGGASVTIQQLTIEGVAGAAEIAPRLAEMLTALLEGDAIQAGAT